MLNELEIKSVKYYTDLDGETNIGIIMTLIDDTVFYVPLSQDNTHYNEIMRQVEAGELTIEEAD
tara:strand:+ start:330 stop:521 length:192 start_codon:yes stop_codon:yes gene_type:complete